MAGTSLVGKVDGGVGISTGTKATALYAGTSGIAVDSINNMSPASFENKLDHMSAAGIVHILNTPGVSDDKKNQALLALDKKYPPIVDPTDNSIGGEDETPEEKLKKLLQTLKDKVAGGEKLTANDTKELQAAVQAVNASQPATSASR